MIPAVLCPGTYDPITCGHTAIISRAAAIFGHATVVVMNNSEKRTMFSADRRFEMAKAAFEGRTDVDVYLCGGLLADYALSLGGAVIVKGVRDGADFSYEMNIAQINRSLGGVETLITYPTTQTHSDVPQEIREKNGITESTLRLSVGIENAEDLIYELEKVFQETERELNV